VAVALLLALLLLTGEGNPVPLREIWRGHRATVLIFWSANCPCVRRYQDRVEALLERYQAKGVAVFGVSSNADETLAEVLRVANARDMVDVFVMDLALRDRYTSVERRLTIEPYRIAQVALAPVDD
jgi:hypothetical protein